MATSRDLTDKQHKTLDRIEIQQPHSTVVDWIDKPGFGRGPVIVNESGDYLMCNTTGRLKKIR